MNNQRITVYSPLSLKRMPVIVHNSCKLQQIAAASPPPVSGSPGVRMGVSADAVPFPPPVALEVEPEDPNTEVNNSNFRSIFSRFGDIQFASPPSNCVSK